MTIYGYARCSTNEEKQDITRQIRELEANGVNRENIYTEYISGTSDNKVELNRLLETVEANDVIIANEVSRISRSTKQLLSLIELAEEKQIKLILGGLELDCTEKGKLDPMTKAMLTMVGAFAELERDMISERVKSGLKNAKAKGTKLGRPQTTIDDIPQNFKDAYKLVKEKKINKSQLIKMLNISRGTAYKYIKIIENEQN